ncbi:ubiquitin-40S ribosomal protein S27a [Penicillium coprophilum]|uniref:ubiquitin-40S ribosomal protein S27a n=1 Tax=Penicillium coprophilum TaxID=36646 RepID=UPI002382AA97|nr:ubiquitin-40S ribosomal protein S27a [Penicillium coprophilum]KAJ5158555.1 ubiquitin-40S ribosomal protein S27a [Penicillium coprophilum]
MDLDSKDDSRADMETGQLTWMETLDKGFEEIETNLYIEEFELERKYHHFRHETHTRDHTTILITNPLPRTTIFFNLVKVEEDTTVECGAGVFMAAMHNRQYCGKCHLTYVFDEAK